MGRQGEYYYWEWRRPQPEDFGLLGLALRFAINVAALWFSQLVVTGFDVEDAPALIFGAVIFGVINAIIKPVVKMFSCLLTILTLGLFTLIINTAMLGLTAWIAGQLDLDFKVDGFIAAFLGALVISIVSTILSAWAGENILSHRREW